MSQINVALLQLDKVIQQNAAASEELAGMSGELSLQATRLSESIDFFKIRTQENPQASAEAAVNRARVDRSPSMRKETKSGARAGSVTTAIVLKDEGGDKDFEEF